MERDTYTDEYYVTSNGEKYQIFPMKLKYKTKVPDLMNQLDINNLYLNLPTPTLDENGNVVLDKKNKPVMDSKAYDAMIEIFMLALQKNKKEVEEIVDLANGVTIIDHFLQVSSLKKKIQQEIEIKALGVLSTQDLSKTQA